ncbi:Hypothetical predicted protein [Paramuricea clavata]|uniref:Uncharacterized protein n=1 Tax=Paramuricea clavata TaxID=317549 RepID=A0A7D9D5L7_PARCT|nr:Hypothetical predicted protein [Paramuricea clavata]
MEMIVLRNSALIGNREVTTIRSDDGSDTFYFAVGELAAALGYIRTQNAVTRHTKEWMRTTLENIKGSSFQGPLHTPGGEQPNRVFVTEPGLYSLVSRSKLPAAENFQRWVFEHVLPSIRKTGTYTLPGVLNTIKGIDDMKLRELVDDEKVEARSEFVHKGNIVKDKRRVESGKKGGLVVQEKIRQTKKELEVKEFQVYEREKEATELRIEVSCMKVIIDVLEEERDELEEERDDLEDERDRFEEKVQDLKKELVEKIERIHELEDENERLLT